MTLKAGPAAPAPETREPLRGRRRVPAGTVRIGISGWRYKPWRGVFYPRHLPEHRELAHASRIFGTIEINGTFYRLQKPEFFERWAEQTPDGFVFAVKGSRYITHMKKLKDPEQALARFFASGLLRLGPKLGPILWQLPPNYKFDAARLAAFFRLLPRDTTEMVALARKAAGRGRRRRAAQGVVERPVRHAVEVRNESFRNPQFVELLRVHNIGLVCADAVEWPRLMDVTSDFIYCRLHGSEVLYVRGYDEAALQAWGRRVAVWARGREPDDAERMIDQLARRRATRDVYVYFDNDAKVRAPFDAQRLGAIVAASLV